MWSVSRLSILLHCLFVYPVYVIDNDIIDQPAMSICFLDELQLL